MKNLDLGLLLALLTLGLGTQNTFSICFIFKRTQHYKGVLLLWCGTVVCAAGLRCCMRTCGSLLHTLLRGTRRPTLSQPLLTFGICLWHSPTPQTTWRQAVGVVQTRAMEWNKHYTVQKSGVSSLGSCPGPLLSSVDAHRLVPYVFFQLCWYLVQTNLYFFSCNQYKSNLVVEEMESGKLWFCLTKH